MLMMIESQIIIGQRRRTRNYYDNLMNRTVVLKSRSVFYYFTVFIVTPQLYNHYHHYQPREAEWQERKKNYCINIGFTSHLLSFIQNIKYVPIR